MFKSPSFFKKFYLYYLIILLFIYPLSPLLFNLFLNIKEPVFLPPVDSGSRLIIRADNYGSGYFNARRSNGARKHKGLDLSAPPGNAVYASKSGITKTGWVITGMGKYVKINHANNYSTLYGHLSKIAVSNNQWVWQGDKVGEVGKTGNANHRGIEPHLHFEIRHNNIYLDPMECMSGE